MPTVHYAVTGLKEAEAKLAKVISGIENNTRKGVKEAAKIVKASAQELTSIDTGDLITSAYLRTGYEDAAKTQPAALIGYSESYAAAVHEMKDGTNWQKAGAENKFLEKGLVRNITNIFNTLKKFAGRQP